MSAPSQFPASPYFTLLQTPHGGRSLFATRPIPADTLIHISHGPFASVLFREFRKEVCAWCFAYDGWKGLRCKIDDKDSSGSGGERFCDEACRDLWLQDGIRGGGIRDRASKAIDAATRKMKKLKQPPDHADVDPRPETAWKFAESLPIQSCIYLDEIELPIARLVSSALVSIYLNSSSFGNMALAPSYLTLQQNELSHILSRPYILATHTRIYQFLRTALMDVPEFATYIGDGSVSVRGVLNRDTGNSFGIWEEVTGEEREMFGWGIWVDASFFNHSSSSISSPRLSPSVNTLHSPQTAPRTSSNRALAVPCTLQQHALSQWERSCALVISMSIPRKMRMSNGGATR
jgi:hypothetical protein